MFGLHWMKTLSSKCSIVFKQGLLENKAVQGLIEVRKGSHDICETECPLV